MFTHPHHHHAEKLFHLKSKLGLLYWHLIIQAFALSLVSIFVPIYLLIIGFTLPEVFFFVLIEWTVFGLCAPLYGKIIHRTGVKEVILMRTPVYAGALVLLSLLEHSLLMQQYYYIIAVFTGFSGGIYTLSITSLFAKYIGEKKQSEKTGEFFALPKLASLIGPALGGIIAVLLGFIVLFLFAVVLLFLSIIPLSFVKQNIDHPPFTCAVFARMRKMKKECFMLAAYGIKTLVFVILIPLTLYVIAHSVLTTGVVISILSVASALVTIAVGVMSDKHKRRPLVKFSSIGTAVVFLLIGASLGAPFLVYLLLIASIVCLFVDIPYETHLYRQARKKSPLEFLAFKEFFLWVGRFVFLIAVMCIGAQLSGAFYLGAVASCAFLFF